MNCLHNNVDSFFNKQMLLSAALGFTAIGHLLFMCIFINMVKPGASY